MGLYKQIKKQYDSHTWTAAKTGEYIDFQVGDEDPLPGMEGAVEPLTQMETSAREVHENMNAVIWQDKSSLTSLPQLLSHVMWSSVKSQGQFAMIIALKCKPHSTLQLQIFAESFKLSLWLLQVWVQFSPHIQYENINGPVVI